MPRIVENKLTARGVITRKPGTYADGGGLYLVIGKPAPTTGAQGRSWIFRYVTAGRVREMGLGPARDVTLADARDLAADLRRQRRAGVDPADARQAERIKVKVERAASVTFEHAAEAYIKENAPGWKNAKHGDQWRNTLATYAYPFMGALPVAAVDVDHVLAALRPIWTNKPETAGRVRGRIETVLSYAKANRWRTGDNPATWRGHLDAILPAKANVVAVEHHAAMPYADLPAFLVKLCAAPGIAARALEFTILNASRTGEVIGATWTEIDRQSAGWLVPAARMKSARDHRVPLGARSLAILDEMAVAGTVGFLFPGAKAGKGLSNMSMDAVLRRLGVDVTVHGFRSTFRDWAADQTSFPREVAEACLAHVLRDSTEAAYRRSDLFGKRRELMTAWAVYCEGKGDDSAT